MFEESLTRIQANSTMCRATSFSARIAPSEANGASVRMKVIGAAAAPSALVVSAETHPKG
jgi:hypothetical protein